MAMDFIRECFDHKEIRVSCDRTAFPNRPGIPRMNNDNNDLHVQEMPINGPSWK
jgi:hypothetical protein